MSLVEYLMETRTPLALAKELANTARDNALLQRRVHELEVQQFWLTRPAHLQVDSTYGSAGAYLNGSDETRTRIDEAIKTADALFGARRESRDRRKTDSQYAGDDRRLNDRRSMLRSDTKSDNRSNEY